MHQSNRLKLAHHVIAAVQEVNYYTVERLTIIMKFANKQLVPWSKAKGEYWFCASCSFKHKCFRSIFASNNFVICMSFIPKGTWWMVVCCSLKKLWSLAVSYTCMCNSCVVVLFVSRAGIGWPFNCSASCCNGCGVWEICTEYCKVSPGMTQLTLISFIEIYRSVILILILSYV